MASAGAPVAGPVSEGASVRSQTPMPLPASVPHGIAQEVRLMTALMQDGDRPGLRTELELAPKELGRVVMVLQQGDRGPTLQIVADRPETYDLFRRNVDVLTRTMQSEGVFLAGLDLSPRGEERPPPRSGPDAGGTPPPQAPQDAVTPDQPPHRQGMRGADGLDLRL
jgi:hypothetical protein